MSVFGTRIQEKLPLQKRPLQTLSLSEALSLDLHRECIITIVGAGGKTTLMFRLADELAKSGLRVVVTTTVKIYRPSHFPVCCHLIHLHL